jgi:hypothetical protein
VEVLKAPKIYLKKPLPRDRIQIGTPLEFVWESEKALKSYNLKLSNGQNFDVTDNFKVLNFDKEQDIVWSIEAHDADGFRVPAMYQSTVYLRHDALAAPKLLKPKMVDEADTAGSVDSASGEASESAATKSSSGKPSSVKPSSSKSRRSKKIEKIRANENSKSPGATIWSNENSSFVTVMLRQSDQPLLMANGSVAAQARLGMMAYASVPVDARLWVVAPLSRSWPLVHSNNSEVRTTALCRQPTSGKRVTREKSEDISGQTDIKKLVATAKNELATAKTATAIVTNLFGEWLQKKLNYLEFAAEAQILRKKNVVFEWEPVEGANQYIIEISSDPEFKTPEVVETLSSTHFVWKKYDPKKKYFWRVASGNSNGRMGLFSEAAPLEVVVETKSRAAEAKAERKAKQLTAEKNEEAQKAKQSADGATKSWTPQAEGPQYATQAKWSIAYAPGFKIANLPGEQNIKIDLSGAVPLAADFKYRSAEINERFYFVDFYVSPQTWKSKTEVAGVTQPDLKYNEVFLSIRTAEKNSDLQYGLAAHTDFYGRVTGASIGTESLTFVGAEVAKLMNPQVTLEGAFMISGSFSEIKLAACYKNYFANSDENAETKYFYGTNLISALQSGTYGSGHQTQVQFLIGISGF